MSDWEEPFGIVMLEAMACGTKLVGLRRGAVGEVIEDFRTGIICDDLSYVATGYVTNHIAA